MASMMPVVSVIPTVVSAVVIPMVTAVMKPRIPGMTPRHPHAGNQQEQE